MSFFEGNTSDGDYESQIEPIPDDTKARAIVEKVEWKTSDWATSEFISLQWSILGGPHANRKVFQKLHVNDSGKKDKALKMLAAIDANCGGALMKADTMPSNDDLCFALLNKPVGIMIKVYDIDGDGKNVGNWICAIKPLSGGAQAVQAQQTPPPQAEQVPDFDINSDDIPF